MCLAKNRQSAAKVGRLFVERCVKKYYIALIQGVPCSEVFDIDYDIGEDPTENEQHRMCARLPDVEQSRIPLKPRTARTKVLLLETGTYNGHDASCVLLKPITGRRHQLRVHLTSKGHPIVGDYTYANDTEPHRMFLHAMRLMLPLQDTPLDIETPNPFTSDEQFQKLWKSKNVLRPFHTAQERMEAFSFIDNLQ